MVAIKRLGLALLGGVALTVTSLTTASGAAIVTKLSGDFVCGVDAGDILGLPQFVVENATVTIVETPGGWTDVPLFRTSPLQRLRTGDATGIPPLF